MADAILALTAAQTGIWYGQQIHPDSPMYNAGEYVELHGNLDVPQLAEALRLLVSEADTLRAHILDDGDTPVLGIHREVPVDLTTYDMTDSPSPLRDAVEHMRGRLRHPVNLRTEPPFEYAVYRLGERYWAFFYRYHHIGVDGYSVALLTQRIAEIYSQLCNDGRVSPSPFERLAALVDADAAYRRSEQCQQDADYWRAEIAAAGTPATLGRIPNGLPGALLRVRCSGGRNGDTPEGASSQSGSHLAELGVFLSRALPARDDGIRAACVGAPCHGPHRAGGAPHSGYDIERPTDAHPH